jgi:hypothetical protein
VKHPDRAAARLRPEALPFQPLPCEPGARQPGLSEDTAVEDERLHAELLERRGIARAPAAAVETPEAVRERVYGLGSERRVSGRPLARRLERVVEVRASEVAEPTRQHGQLEDPAVRRLRDGCVRSVVGVGARVAQREDE